MKNVEAGHISNWEPQSWYMRTQVCRLLENQNRAKDLCCSELDLFFGKKISSFIFKPQLKNMYDT